MLSKMEKIIELLEKLIEFCWEFILNQSKKLVPNSLINKYQSLSAKIEAKKNKIKTNIFAFLKEKFHLFKDRLIKLKTELLVIFHFPLQKRINETFLKLNNFFKETPLKEIWDLWLKFIAPYKELLREKFKKAASSQFFIASAALVLIFSGFFTVVISSKDIYQKEYPSRTPASVQEYDTHPEYKDFKEKTLTIQNIKVPLQVERAGKITSITVDFSLRTTTKFAKIYLENNEHKLRDYFFTSVEPILSDFVIEQEGKEVIKEKIKADLHQFLIEQKVEGEVDDVRILFIIAS